MTIYEERFSLQTKDRQKPLNVELMCPFFKKINKIVFYYIIGSIVGCNSTPPAAAPVKHSCFYGVDIIYKENCRT